MAGYGNRFAALPIAWLVALASRRCLHMEDSGFDAFFVGRMWRCPPKLLAERLPTRKLPKSHTGGSAPRGLAGALQGRSEIDLRGGFFEVPSAEALAALPQAGFTHIRELFLRAGATVRDAADPSFITHVAYISLFTKLTPEARAIKEKFTHAIRQVCHDGQASQLRHYLDAALHFRTAADLAGCGKSAEVTAVRKVQSNRECGQLRGFNETMRCAVPWVLQGLRTGLATSRAGKDSQALCVFVMSDKPSAAAAVRAELLRLSAVATRPRDRRRAAEAPRAISVVSEQMVPGLHRAQLTFLDLKGKNVTKWVPQWRESHLGVPVLGALEWQTTQWHTGPLHRIALADASAALAHPAMLGWLVFSEARLQLSSPASTLSGTANFRGRGLVGAATAVAAGCNLVEGQPGVPARQLGSPRHTIPSPPCNPGCTS